MLHEKFILRQFGFFLFVNLVKSSIDGLSYIDQNDRRPLTGLYPRGEDPCNPLYWYPRNIPEYCNYNNSPIPVKPAPSFSIPIPAPMPQPNFVISIPTLPGFGAVPYGVPIAPSNTMFPVPLPMSTYPYVSNPDTSNLPQAGMVPGLPGIVTKDGGINILPFSDAYSDLIERHKNQMIRKRLEKLIQDYEDFPNGQSYRRLRKYARRNL